MQQTKMHLQRRLPHDAREALAGAALCESVRDQILLKLGRKSKTSGQDNRMNWIDTNGEYTESYFIPLSRYRFPVYPG